MPTLRAAIAALNLHPETAQKLQNWLVKPEQACQLDEAADESFYKLSNADLKDAQLNLSERHLVLSQLPSDAEPGQDYYSLSVASPSSLAIVDLKRLQALGMLGLQLANQRPLLLNYRPHYASALPLQIFHPAFGTFLDIFHNSSPSPERRDFAFLADFAVASADIFSDEEKRQHSTSSLFSRYLQLPFYQQPDLIWIQGSKQCPDAALMDANPGSFMGVLAEVKNEGKSTSSDPYFQGGVCYYKFWCQQDRSCNLYHQHTCCPALMLEVIGPALRISGLAFADRVICQPLTPMLPLLPLMGIDTEMMQMAARALVALCITARDLLHSYAYVRQLQEGPDEALQAYCLQQHQSLFSGKEMAGLIGPAPRTILTRQLPYRLQLPGLQVQQLMPKKQLYLVSSQTAGRRLIKYARSYGASVHKAWAEEGLAPALYSCLQLPGGWWEVQMEFLSEDQQWCRLDRMQHHRTAAVARLAVAHRVPVDGDLQGVHGDARDVNVFVRMAEDGTFVARFIDFDWAGAAGMVRYPPFMNHQGVQWPAGASDGCLIQAAHDIELLSNACQRRIVPYTWY